MREVLVKLFVWNSEKHDLYFNEVVNSNENVPSDIELKVFHYPEGTPLKQARANAIKAVFNSNKKLRCDWYSTVTE